MDHGRVLGKLHPLANAVRTAAPPRIDQVHIGFVTSNPFTQEFCIDKGLQGAEKVRQRQWRTLPAVP